MNRITVVGDDTISAQARTYAEYRVFAALARHTRSVRRVRVVLRHTDERSTCDSVTCVVTASLEPAGSLRIRVRAPHVYAAINRAVERLGDGLGHLAGCLRRPLRLVVAQDAVHGAAIRRSSDDEEVVAGSQLCGPAGSDQASISRDEGNDGAIRQVQGFDGTAC